MERVLLVDSQDVSRQIMRERLEQDGCLVVECDTGEKAMSIVQDGFKAIVLSNLPEGTSAPLVREIRSAVPDGRVILSAASAAETIEALRDGAYYATRPPLDPDEVAVLIGRIRTQSGEADSSRASSPVESGLWLAYRLPSQGIDFRELEREVLSQALRLASGNQTRAASLLRLTRDQIRYRMAKFGMTSRDIAATDGRAA
jgi:DNA-binding NtrC family response regulator